MATISQTTGTNTFSWIKVFKLSTCQHWFRKWLGAELATSHFLNQWWPSLRTHICATRPQWRIPDISSIEQIATFSKRHFLVLFWPTKMFLMLNNISPTYLAGCLAGLKSTLRQVMAYWCRQATNHCMRQSWPRSFQRYCLTVPICVDP